MKYEVIPSNFFLEQLDSLKEKTLEILDEKIQLLEINPARNKQIVGYPENLFRIRFVDYGISKRLIYGIEGKIVKLFFILNRSKNYKEMKSYLKKVRNEK